MTEYVLEMWDDVNWQNLQRYSVTYLGENIDEMLLQNWDGSWQDHYLSVHSHSGSLLMEVMNYLWDGSDWLNDLKETYEYDDNNPVTILIEEWFNSGWTNFELISNTFMGNDLDEILIQEWLDNGWVNLTLTDYIYSMDADDELLPEADFKLNNYPNPFNPQTCIHFGLPYSCRTKLDIYNVKGQLVKTLVNDDMSVGEHFILWDSEDMNGNQVESGIYFYKLETNNTGIVKKMILLR
jgi:hypothetical protein